MSGRVRARVLITGGKHGRCVPTAHDSPAPPSQPRLVSGSGVPPRPFAEFSLGFVLARSSIVGRGAAARLDAVEHTLGELVRRWSTGAPLSPARDVRTSAATLDELMRWIEGAAPERDAIARLGVYHSGAVADDRVPAGWIRVYLGGRQRDPGELRAHRG